MVKGLAVFKEHFSELQDCYVLIGGAACDLHMNEAGLAFRATRDLDIVLCVEALTDSFAEQFWLFIREGDYQQREKSSGEKEFYRFSDPGDGRYPQQIELFSRSLDAIPTSEDTHLTPLPLEGEASSLSAILLDDDYYACLKSGTVIVDGVRILNEEFLIVFKAKAVLDLTERKIRGEFIKSDDVKKHRYDVFRLLQLLPSVKRVELPSTVKKDLKAFVALIQQDKTSDEQLSQMNVGLPFVKIVESLNNIFKLIS